MNAPRLKVLTSRELAEMPRPEDLPLSEYEIEQIRDRCRRATPGPWTVARENLDFPLIGSPVCRMDEDEDVVIGIACDVGPTHDPLDDAEFIAQARIDVPRLLAELDRRSRQS